MGDTIICLPDFKIFKKSSKHSDALNLLDGSVVGLVKGKIVTCGGLLFTTFLDDE